MNAHMKQQILRITITAIFLALLIAGQLLFGLIGAPLAQYFVGSWVNLILALAALVIGWPYAVSLGLISPFVALLVGIAPPFIEIIPLIALANAMFGLIIFFINKIKVKATLQPLIAVGSVILATVIKVGLMYITIVAWLLPALGIPPVQRSLLSAVYSINQLPTAIIGGSLAIIVAIPVKQALRYRHGGHA